MGLERKRRRMGHLEWSMARKGPIQPSAPVAEAWMDAGNGSCIRRVEPRLSDQPMGLRQIPMATEVVVGPLGVWPPPILGSLCSVSLADPSASTGTVRGILVR